MLGSLRKPNPALWWVTAGTLCALAAAIYLPSAAALFRFAPIAPHDLAIAAAAGIAGVLWYDLYKVLRPRAA